MAQWRIDSHEWKQPHNVTLFEAFMLADPYGNLVGPANPSGVAVDAFGRARMSVPLTLFDSSHRYKDNGLWNTSNTAGTTYAFSANQGLVNLNLPTTANAEIVRETTKVFSYQPGKSLFILNTVVPATPKANLRQRVGYFGANNGMYLEIDGTDVYFVERSSVSGSIVETRVAQADWSNDTLQGSSVNVPGQGIGPCPSGILLDPSKAQIFWMDIEWLGLGSVRMGFVIDGKIIHCHTFNHANKITSTYITTASLPLRYEIKNTGTTASSSTMAQVCSSVISEGGYELRGLQQSAGHAIGSPRSLTTASTSYPVLSIRLKSTALDAIIILTALSLLATTNNANYKWSIVQSCTTTGGSWSNVSSDSAVEYNTTATSVTSGRIVASGYTNGSNQGSTPVSLLKEALFKFQLERNGLTDTPYELALVVASDTNGASVYASFDWEEISR
jgi:hypothetical protein